MAVFPSDSIRTKDWGSEVLTDSDLETQLDLLHSYFQACLNATTGHAHTGASNQGPKISPANLLIASQATGDLLYASSATAWSRLAKGTAGQTLRMNSGATAPEWGNSGVTSGSFKNLSITRPTAATVLVVADEVILNDGTKLTSVNATLTMPTDIDTGSEANVWYYIYLTSASAGKFSASAITPTGITVYALVGAVHNTAGDFVDFTQTGKKYVYTTPITVVSGTITSWQAVDVTAVVPSGISSFAFGTFKNTEAYGSNAYVSNVGSDTTNKIGMSLQWTTSGFGSNSWNFPWQLSILTANTLYMYAGGGSNYFYLAGFEITKL